MAGEWSSEPPYGTPSGFVRKYSASCFCGRVKFQVSADPLAAKICDCSACQRLHGAPCQWAVLFKKEAVKFDQSSFEHLRWYNCSSDFATTSGDERELPSKVQCKHCGSWVADEGRRMFMAFPTLFEFVKGDGSPPEFPPAFMPTCHIFCASRALVADDGLAYFLDDRKTPLSMRDVLLDLAPWLDGRAHKGQAGRVGVLGGSVDFTGAPFYAGMAALRVGAELLYLLTEKAASGPLKTLSPELMVSKVYDFEEVNHSDAAIKERAKAGMAEKVLEVLPRLHCLVIGCGLGRHPDVLEVVAKVIEAAREARLPLVIDADGLWLIQDRPDLVRGYAEVVLTPNKAEFSRLGKAIAGRDVSIGEMCELLQGPTIVQKGAVDRIASFGRAGVLECREEGAPRRPGGLGDLLAGTLGVLVAWCKPRRQAPALGCQAGCHVVRRACALAFEKKKRSMVAPDVLEEIGTAFEELCPAKSRRFV
mmetsp:Transcript_31582/g.73624  ORF Transcript_31582/g.73624 Transcript_31582/m.73624 type:complete len:477 (+) Transcript_31582:97-1527(+)